MQQSVLECKTGTGGGAYGGPQVAAGDGGRGQVALPLPAVRGGPEGGFHISRDAMAHQ